VLNPLASAPVTVDYAESRYVDSWLRHPVFGDPSFDSFVRQPGNPIHRGAPPYEWPVNGFLFRDPPSGHWYIYVGDYPAGYLDPPSRCLLYRSTDAGATWTNRGVVLQGDPALFDKGGHTPDVSVVFEGGRYHMVYDWGEPVQGGLFPDTGGVAYAWAEQPEGPWHRAPQPILRNAELAPLAGKYQRTYASTLIRRQHDWMILSLVDSGEWFGWAWTAVTAPQPGGPYGARVLLRHVETDYYHPPLMESFPWFVHDGYVYGGSTSVALNRNFNMLFRAPLERATEPDAWEIYRHGSVWHSDDVEHEASGIWGQTFAGVVENDGTFRVMYPCRDSQGRGTINLAQRPWNQPLRERGFIFTGNKGRSFTALRRGYGEFHLDATLRIRGSARLLWDYAAPLLPCTPSADATLHALMLTRHNALEFSATGWRVIQVDATGQVQEIAVGIMPERTEWPVALTRDKAGLVVVTIAGQIVWKGVLPEAQSASVIGLLAEANTHVECFRFAVTGVPVGATLTYGCIEGLLDRAERRPNWEERQTDLFRYGFGFVAKQEHLTAKWSVWGSQFKLWSPRGPEFGKIEIRLDGRGVATIDLQCEQAASSQPVWTSDSVTDGPHAIVVQAVTGALPVDCLETTSHPAPDFSGRAGCP